MVGTQQDLWLKRVDLLPDWAGAQLPSAQVRRLLAMSVTHKSLRSVQRARKDGVTLLQRLHTAIYAVTLVLAALAIYVVVSLLVGKAHILIDDLRYGRPRTAHLDAFVGHDEAAGHPSHLMAMNLNRQVIVVELPGGDAAKARTITGPYLFGADEDLTPVLLDLRDMDGDGHVDLLLDVRNEQIVYVNRDGVFRLPTATEQAQLNRGSGQ
jgi:hypothetical protein